MKKNRIRSIHDQKYKEILAGLTEARKTAAIPQSALAAAVGLTQPDVSKFENLERRLDVIEFLDVVGYIAANGGDPQLLNKLLHRVLGT